MGFKDKRLENFIMCYKDVLCIVYTVAFSSREQKFRWFRQVMGYLRCILNISCQTCHSDKSLAYKSKR